MTKYEVLTQTLSDGWTNCWTDYGVNDDAPDEGTPSTFDTAAEAQAEIDEHIQDMRESYEEGQANGVFPVDEPFDEEGERAGLAIVEVGKLPPPDLAIETLKHLLTETM